MVRKGETFSFICLKFNVYPLWEYAINNLSPIRIGLNRFVSFYRFKAVEQKGKGSLIKINAQYAQGLKPKDYKQPVLIVKLGNKSGGLLIDGLHRSYRLWKKGQKTIRAYYITDRNILKKHSNIEDFKLE